MLIRARDMYFGSYTERQPKNAKFSIFKTSSASFLKASGFLSVWYTSSATNDYCTHQLIKAQIFLISRCHIREKLAETPCMHAYDINAFSW